MSQTDNSSASQDYRDERLRFAMDYARQLLRTPRGERLVEAYKADPERVLQTLRAAQVLKSSDEYIQHNPQLQKDIQELHEIKKSLAARDQLALEEAHDAAWGMALSGNIGDYKRYAEQLIAAQAKISEIEKIRDTGAIKTLGDDAKSLGEKLESIRDSNDDAPVPDELLDSSTPTLALLESMGGELTNIRASMDKLIEVSQRNMETTKQQLDSVEKLLETAKRNEKSSKKNAKSSNKLATWAIIITTVGILVGVGVQWYFARRAEKNDKTGELVEAVKRFHADTNAQDKNEVARLRAECGEMKSQLAGARKKNDELDTARKQERQQLQREISALKEQMASLEMKLKELKEGSASKTVPSAPPQVKK